jgi:phospholipid transport system substrate-binding protein
MKLKQIVAFSAALFLLQISYAATTPSPVVMLQNVSNTAIVQLKAAKAKSSNGQVKTVVLHKIIETELLPHVDLDLMSRAVLGRNTWESATTAQKADFKEQFTTLVINTYASALKTFDKNKIVFRDVRGGYQGQKVIQVNSLVNIPDSEPLPVVYHLILENNQWYITDLSVEGISLVESYQAQFTPIIADKGLTGLIEILKQNNAQLDA